MVVDHRPSLDPSFDDDVLTGYREAGVAVLLGEHLDDPVHLDRVESASRVVSSGVVAIATITGRTSGEARRAEIIDGFVTAGVAAVLCVTGDHPAARFRDTDSIVFGSEGTVIAHEARRLGAVVAVAESPAAPPLRRRAHRLVAKQRAGADFAILNHAGSVSDVSEFADRADRAGSRLPLIAAVPVMTDRRSVDALAQFPGLHLPPGMVDAIERATDSEGAGVDLAIRMAEELLERPSVAGVNLSGIATGSGPAERARIMRRVAAGVSGRE
ncbi:MAG: methylenetetrahydrofolate reductase [Ilumatobacter sp.]|uniref:methylenetetrahydrofolate reductase n=1 Tax=Ilumatobacter sp. TaxID=1967498 RepID=UPI003C755A92